MSGKKKNRKNESFEISFKIGVINFKLKCKNPSKRSFILIILALAFLFYVVTLNFFF